MNVKVRAGVSGSGTAHSWEDTGQGRQDVGNIVREEQQVTLE